MSRASVATAAFLLSLLPLGALASAPAGVWVLADEVTVDLVAVPATLTIKGVAVLWGAQAYSAPAQGTLFYHCPAGHDVDCGLEWTDLIKAADSGECRGFGSQEKPPGTLYAPGVMPGPADPYPFGVGVVSGSASCQALYAYKPVPPEAGADAGSAPDASMPADGGGGADLASPPDAGPMPDASAPEATPAPDARVVAPAPDNGGAPAPDAAGTGDTAVAPDGSLSGADAAAAKDAGTPGQTIPAEDVGCQGSGARSPLGLAVLLLAALGVRSRRRRLA